MAAESWELRSARLEGAYEQIDPRLGSLESRLSTLELRMETGFAQTHADIHNLRSELLSRMDRQFYWIMGAMGGLLALMVSGFLQLALRLGGH